MFTSMRALSIALRAHFRVQRLSQAGNVEGAITTALAAIERCERVGGRQSLYVGALLRILIGLYSTAGDFAAVRPLEARLAVIDRRILSDDTRDLDAMERLSRVINKRLQSGNAAPMVTLLRPALRVQQQLSSVARLGGRLGLDRLLPYPGVTDLLLSYHAALYSDPAQLAAREGVYRQSLAVWLEGADEIRPHIAGTLYVLAVICARTGRPAEALQYLQQAAAIDDEIVQTFVRTGSEARRLAYLQMLRWGFDLTLSLVHQQFSHSSAAVAAVFDLVLRRKGIAAEALAAQRDVALGGAYPALAGKLKELGRVRAELAERLLAQSPPATPGGGQRSIRALTVEKEQLEADLAGRIPELEIEQRLAGVDRQAVAASLPAGAALVEFVRFTPFNFSAVSAAEGGERWLPARYLGFVLRSDAAGGLRMLDLGPAEQIDTLVTRFRAAIIGDDTVRALRGLGALRVAAYGVDDRSGVGLRAGVVDPLAAALAGATQLLIALDGELGRLPFEVLPGAGGDRLLDRYAISYVSSGRDLVRFGRLAPHPGRPIVVADPDFDLAATHRPGDGSNAPAETDSAPIGAAVRALVERFERLPQTRSEGLAVAAQLGVTPILGSDAVERCVKGAASPRVMHLATHGFFIADRAAAGEGAAVAGEWPAAPGLAARLQAVDSPNPLLRSGLAFAGANSWLHGIAGVPEAEDGILTAEDVSALNLTGTELVVLSACETGLGEVRTGEGVFGLQRAFMLAGASTLVMSLWKVPDQATQELMVDFHTRLAAGDRPAAALRAAQQALRAREPDPFFWGGFVCLGDPGGVAGVTPLPDHARNEAARNAAPQKPDQSEQPDRAALSPESQSEGDEERELAPGAERQALAGVAIVLAYAIAMILVDISLSPAHAVVSLLRHLSGGTLGGDSGPGRWLAAGAVGSVLGGFFARSRRAPDVKIGGCAAALLIIAVLFGIAAFGVAKSTISVVSHGSFRCDPICHVITQHH